MKQIWNKIALLLLPVFLAATLLSLPGYAWCFGDDGHLDVKYIAASGSAAEVSAPTRSDQHEGLSLAQSDEEHCGPCLNFVIQLNDATATKRLENRAPVSIGAIAISTLPSLSAQTVKMVIGNLLPQPPPRIAQSILHHRTVVLLT